MQPVEIRPIPHTFMAEGLLHKLVKRTNKTALYQVFGECGDHNGYEVHAIRVRDKPREKTIKGRTFIQPATERLASSSEFGTYGWSAWDLAHASRLFSDVELYGRPRRLSQMPSDALEARA